MTAIEADASERTMPERSRLRRELRRLDTVFFLISAMVVVDTIGAIAIGGAQAFTWLVVLFVTFFMPSALTSAELGAAIPEEGGAYVWVRMAFGRFAGAMTSLLYWAGTPMWLGGSVDGRGDRRRTSGSSATSSPAGHVRVRDRVRRRGHGGRRRPAPLRQVGADQRRDRADRAARRSSRSRVVALRRASTACTASRSGDSQPVATVFIAIVPVLLYSFVGVELPPPPPRRWSIRGATSRSRSLGPAIGQALMYGDSDPRGADRAARPGRSPRCTA